MKAAQKGKNIRNSAWNLVDIFLYPLVFFLSIPVFIQHLGPEVFGIWMLLNTILVGVQVFNFGLGSGVLQHIAWHIGKDDTDAQHSIMNNSLSMSLFLFFIAFAVTATLAMLVHTADLFAVKPALKQQAALCICLGGGMVGFRFTEQVFTNFYKAGEDYRRAAFIAMSNRLAPLLINLVLLRLHCGIIALIVNILICNTLSLCGCFLLLRKALPGYRFRFEVTLRSATSKFAFVLWFQSLCMILIFQADRYLIVQYFGLAALSYYALTATIFNHLHMGFNAMLGWVSPKFAKLSARNAPVKELYIASRDGLLLVSVSLILLFHFLYPYVLPLVLGAESFGAMRPYIDYFLVLALFLTPSIIPTYFLNAAGQEKRYLYFLVPFTTGTIIAMVIALHYLKQPIAVLYVLIVSHFTAMLFQNFLAESKLFTRQELKTQWLHWAPLPIAACTFLLNTQHCWSFLVLAFVLVYALFRIILKGREHAATLYKA